MHWVIALLALCLCFTAYLLLGCKPFGLTGRERLCWFALPACATMSALTGVWLSGENLSIQACRLLLAALMSLMAVSDLMERAVYDLHFLILLPVGLFCAFFSPGGFLLRILFFPLLLCVFFLLSRRSKGISWGDGRSIAALSLFFSISSWMEIMLLSLLSALIFSLGLLIFHKKTLKAEIPFIPFLLLGVLIELFF